MDHCPKAVTWLEFLSWFAAIQHTFTVSRGTFTAQSSTASLLALNLESGTCCNRRPRRESGCSWQNLRCHHDPRRLQQVDNKSTACEHELCWMRPGSSP
eukprot:3696038-Amphidinium_carterae.1